MQYLADVCGKFESDWEGGSLDNVNVLLRMDCAELTLEGLVVILDDVIADDVALLSVLEIPEKWVFEDWVLRVGGPVVRLLEELRRIGHLSNTAV